MNEGRRRAREYAGQGVDSSNQGNHSAAIEGFTRAIEADPKDIRALLRRGAARGAAGDLRGAASDLHSARRMLPGDGERRRRHWASAQLGEAIRASLRDGVLAPSAGMAEVEALLATMDASIEAFTDALREEPNDPWAHAHRGAASTLAHWLAARFGVDPARVRRYAEDAQSGLAAALCLNGSYAWAMMFQAILLVILGSNEPDDAKRRTLFARAAARAEEAGRADERLPVLHGLVELALYDRDYDKVVELGWTQLARDPDDSVARYGVAVALTRIAETNGAGDPPVEQARRATAAGVVERARQSMLAQRSRLSAMLGGLAMLDGEYEVAAARLNDVLEYPDMETLVFMQCDPTWHLARDPAAGAGSDPRLDAVKDAYARLFPPASSGKRAP